MTKIREDALLPALPFRGRENNEQSTDLFTKFVSSPAKF